MRSRGKKVAIMAAKDARAPSVWPAVRRLLQVAGRQRVWLVAALACDLLSAAVNIVPMFALARFLDAVSAGNVADFWRYLAIFLGLSVLGLPLSFVRTRALGLFSERTLAELRGRVAASAVVLPINTLESQHSGDLLSLFNADLARLKSLMANDLLQALGQSLRAIGALVYLLLISWQLTLVTTVLMPAVFMLLGKLAGPVSRRSSEMQEELGAANTLAEEALASPLVAKSFNLAGIMSARFGRANARVLGKGLQVARLKAIVDAVSGAMGITPFLILFAYGGYLVITGHMTFGNLMAFTNLLNYVTNPLGSLPPTLTSISEGAGAAERTLALLDEQPERGGGAAAVPPHGAGSAIRFQDLTFTYAREPSAPSAPSMLAGINLEVREGETVALVGPSGGGKSTLLKLLLGFYPLPDGQLFLFGRDLNKWQLAAARAQMAFVAQDTFLFPVSIRENILCGRPTASGEEVQRAARAANIHEFIAALPQGYDTVVGERGARLSGGERQRLALARAVLRDAPILLLDEPTAALDAQAEALVQEALERFMTGRTTLVIAHRLATIRHADRILVIDRGRIMEQGTHEELLARGTLYQELYRRQLAGGDAPADAAQAEGGPHA